MQKASRRVPVEISFLGKGGGRALLTLSRGGKERKFAISCWGGGLFGAGETQGSKNERADPEDILVFPSLDKAFLHILGAFLADD